MNSRQERKHRRNLHKKFTHISEVFKKEIGPMVKDECQKDFREILVGLEEILLEMKRSHRREPKLSGYWLDEADSL